MPLKYFLLPDLCGQIFVFLNTSYQMQLGLPIDSDHQGHEPFQGNLVNSPAMNHAVPILEPVRKHIISSLEMPKDYMSPPAVTIFKSI